VEKRLLEKGEKYMVMYKAKINNTGEKYFLELNLKKNKLLIPLTEDKPIEVKQIFNDLIIELKKVDFNFKFEPQSENLYDQICDEYIKQLNNELKNVRKELSEYNLII
jgi:hypothetical protein